MRVLFFILLAIIAGGRPAAAVTATTETIDEAMCRLIDGAAKTRKLPVELFSRLIWRESAFRSNAVSPKGAQGVAQFMPGTAAERGLADPFDPEQAIPEAARLLSDLRAQFGSFGLAAAAYNAGAGRVQGWLASGRGLPDETRRYVLAITGRPAEDWAEAAREGKKDDELETGKGTNCLEVTAALRRGRAGQPELAGMSGMELAPFAPWGVQLAGNFSKSVALRSFTRALGTYVRVLGTDVRPMIIGTLLRSRGSRPFYRVRVPSQTRQDAEATCARIRGAGGSCIVLRS